MNLPTIIADALTNYRPRPCRHTGEPVPGKTACVRCTRPGILTDACRVEGQVHRPCYEEVKP